MSGGLAKVHLYAKNGTGLVEIREFIQLLFTDQWVRRESTRSGQPYLIGLVEPLLDETQNGGYTLEARCYQPLKKSAVLARRTTASLLNM